jgi:hypothetical protein
MKTLAVATIGQFNPPVREHLKALEKVGNTAKEMDGDPILFITHTQNETNSLPWEVKCQYVKSIVGPQINICDDPAVETLADFLAWIGEHQYKDLVLLVGSDKLETVSSFVQKYNDQPTSEGRYGFSSVKIASIGSKDPDNLSMLARNAAIDGDFDAFKRSVAVNSEKLASDMFNTLRKFSGLGENVINTTRLSINKRELTKFFGDLDESVIWDVLEEEHQTGEQKSLFDPDVYPPKKNAVSLKPTTADEVIERERKEKVQEANLKKVSAQFDILYLSPNKRIAVLSLPDGNIGVHIDPIERYTLAKFGSDFYPECKFIRAKEIKGGLFNLKTLSIKEYFKLKFERLDEILTWIHALDDSVKGEESLYEAANRTVKTISFQFPSDLIGFSDIHSSSQYSHVLTSFGRGVIGPKGEIKIGPAGSSHRDLSKNLGDTKRFYWGYSREHEVVYVVSKNAMDTDILKNKKILQVILSNVFDFMKLSIAPGGLKIRENFLGYMKTGAPLNSPDFFPAGVPFQLYRNPSRKEWKDIGPCQRGWIAPSGDVYFTVTEDPKHPPIHFQILQLLLIKSGVNSGKAKELAYSLAGKPTIADSAENILKYGIGVESGSDYSVGLMESLYLPVLHREHKDVEIEIKKILEKAQAKLPYLRFHYKSISNL